MNIIEAYEKINFVEIKLLEMGKLAFIDKSAFVADEITGSSPLEGSDKMSEISPKEDIKLHECWSEIQKSIPSGFDMDGNLIRHLSFNEANDWYNISQSDIPRELNKIKEYKKRLALIEYLGNLHPEVSRVSEIVLNGDIEMALKGVFANLDSKIRLIIKASPGESTVPAIGKAFKEGRLAPVYKENLDGVRSFLQGVLGYFRSMIVHNTLSPARNNIEASLSLFCLAHETFKLLDACSKNTNR